MHDFDYNYNHQDNMYSDLHYVSNHHKPHSDIHVAHVSKPGEGCCGKKPKDCECVTSADILRWDSLSALEPLTAVEHIESVSAIDNLVASADLWNSTYSTVSANSAKWTSTITSISAVQDLIGEISAKIPEEKDLHFDTQSITGDGTTNAPFGVAEYKNIMNTLQNLITFSASFFNKAGYPIWMSTTVEGSKIESDLKNIIDTNKDQATELADHDKLIKHLLDEIESEPKWEQIPAVTPESIKSLTAAGTIYYT